MSILGRVSTIREDPPIDGEFGNIVNTINNLDNGNSKWNTVSVIKLILTDTVTGSTYQLVITNGELNWIKLS